MYSFNQAVSFIIHCETQDEVDRYWERLSEAGETIQCGWLKDRFGLAWQVVPNAFGELMRTGNAEQSRRVMGAMLQMTKFDIAALRHAYENA